MRKFPVLLLLVGVLTMCAWDGPSFAVEAAFDGQYRIRAIYLNDVKDFDKSQSGDNDSCSLKYIQNIFTILISQIDYLNNYRDRYLIFRCWNFRGDYHIEIISFCRLPPLLIVLPVIAGLSCLSNIGAEFIGYKHLSINLVIILRVVEFYFFPKRI